MASRKSKRPTRTDHALTPKTLARLLAEAEKCPDFSVIAGRAGFSLRHLYQFFNAGLMPGAEPLCAELAAGIMAARAEITGLAFAAMKTPLKKRRVKNTKAKRGPTDAEIQAGIISMTEENKILEVDAKHALEVYREMKVDVLRVEDQIPTLEDRQVSEAELVKQLSPAQRSSLLAALTGMPELADGEPADAQQHEDPDTQVEQRQRREEDPDDD